VCGLLFLGCVDGVILSVLVTCWLVLVFGGAVLFFAGGLFGFVCVGSGWEIGLGVQIVCVWPGW